MASQKELREAYKEGMLRGAAFTPVGVAQYLDHMAREAYPPKMVERPRVVMLHTPSGYSEAEFRLTHTGDIEFRGDHVTGWTQWIGAGPALADLFANPTEEVEVDD